MRGRRVLGWRHRIAVSAGDRAGDGGVGTDRADRRGHTDADTPDADTTDADTDVSEPLRLANACAAVVDGRDYALAESARHAQLDALEAVVTREPPAADELATWVEVIEAYRGGLATAVDELAAVETSSPSAWSTIVGAGEVQVRLLDERLAALASDDWETAASRFPTAPGPDDTVLAAMDELSITSPDCASMWITLGNPPEQAPFIADAAAACRIIVDRRARDGNDALNDVVFDAVLQGHEGELEPTPELSDAVEALLAEWESTRAELAAVEPPEDGSTPPVWTELLAMADDRVAGFGTRAAALASGDRAELDAAFELGGAFQIPGIAYSGTILDGRDCAALTG